MSIQAMDPSKVCPRCFDQNQYFVESMGCWSGICARCGFDQAHYQPGNEHGHLFLPLFTLLEDKYYIGCVLGYGGYGVVYLAYEPSLERRVAIKEFYPAKIATRNGSKLTCRTTHDPERNSEIEDVFSRVKVEFKREAITLAMMKHPRIVAVHNSFENNDTFYFVMEYLEGCTLEKLLLWDSRKQKYGRSLNRDEIATFVENIVPALDYLHHGVPGKQIIHRDLKPANIFLMDKQLSHPVIMDLGIAKVIYGEHGETTATAAGGTPLFRAPEQITGKPKPAPFTDLFSLGLTVYTALSNRRPVPAEERSLGTELLSIQRDDLPPELEYWIHKCVHLDATQRYQSADEFLAAFRQAVKGEWSGEVPAPRASAWMPGEGGEPVEMEMTTGGGWREAAVTQVAPKANAAPSELVITPALKPVNRKAQSFRGLWVGGGLLAVLAGGALIWGGGGDSSQNPPSTPPPAVDVGQPPVAAPPAEVTPSGQGTRLIAAQPSSPPAPSPAMEQPKAAPGPSASCQLTVGSAPPLMVTSQVWNGPCVGGKAHGEGRGYFQLPDQGVSVAIVGRWEDGRLVGGQGVIRDGKSGNWYAGELGSGVLNGLGVHVWKSGTVYAGAFENGKRSGKGVLSRGGDRYEGVFRAGEPVGMVGDRDPQAVKQEEQARAAAANAEKLEKQLQTLFQQSPA